MKTEASAQSRQTLFPARGGVWARDYHWAGSSETAHSLTKCELAWNVLMKADSLRLGSKFNWRMTQSQIHAEYELFTARCAMTDRQTDMQTDEVHVEMMRVISLQSWLYNYTPGRASGNWGCNTAVQSISVASEHLLVNNSTRKLAEIGSAVALDNYEGRAGFGAWSYWQVQNNHSCLEPEQDARVQARINFNDTFLIRLSYNNWLC